MPDNNNSAQTPALEHIGVAFLKALFQHTDDAYGVYLSSLSNERNDPKQPSERRVCTRDPEAVVRFAGKHDKNDRGRGLFYCVSTIEGVRRNKEAAREVGFLWQDVDTSGITCTASEAEAALMQLPFPPSILVWSGHGWHPYWLLKEAVDVQAERDRIERILRQLADVIGGDTQVCEVARLMRLPGSHNTKGGEHIPVRVHLISSASNDGAPIEYELSDIEEWLTEAKPVIARKAKPSRVSHETHAAVDPTDPFIRAADILGWKPPIDVQAALDAMTYPGNVHSTQVSVSASLLTSGHPIEEVVEVVMEATRRAAAGQSGWNWQAEEASVRSMCLTWVEKHPPPEREVPIQSAPASGHSDREPPPSGQADREEVAENVVDLGTARAKKKAKAKPKGDSSAAEVVADGVVNALRDRGEDIMLAEGLMWLYADGIWREAAEADEQRLLVLIQQGFRALGVIPKGNTLSLALRHLREAPGLFMERVPWAGPGTIVCENGVLQLDRPGFEQQSPKNYARRRIGAAYVPDAACLKFLALLASMFAGRDDAQEIIGLLQEWIGAALAVDRLTREERKALVLVGPSRTGKTELGRIVRQLLGGPIAACAVEEISGDFGLQPFVGMVAWIRDDAINEGDKVDPQRFKTLITGEPVDVRRKGLINLNGVSFSVPVLLTTNSLPRARDASDAIFNRSLVIEMENVINEEDAAKSRLEHNVTAGTIGDYVWAQEGSGILNWALAGLERLRERGRYDPPQSVREAIQRFKDANNPVGEWMREATVRADGGKVNNKDMLCAYHGWQMENEGEGAKALGARSFWPQLRQYAPWITQVKEHGGHRYCVGLHLTDVGQRYWEAHNFDAQLRGGMKGASGDRDQVNKKRVSEAEEDAEF